MQGEDLFLCGQPLRVKIIIKKSQHRHDGANIYLKPYWKVEYQLEGSCPGGNVTKQKIVRTRIMSALQGMSTIASRQSSLMNSPSIFSTCKVRGEHMRVEREANQLQKN